MLGFDQSFLTDEHFGSPEMFVPLPHSAEKQALSTKLQPISTRFLAGLIPSSAIYRHCRAAFLRDFWMPGDNNEPETADL